MSAYSVESPLSVNETEPLEPGDLIEVVKSCCENARFFVGMRGTVISIDPVEYCRCYEQAFENAVHFHTAGEWFCGVLPRPYVRKIKPPPIKAETPTREEIEV